MPKLVSFFGTLGSGKTTRASLLSGFLGVPFYSEKADSPFLEDMFLHKNNALLNQLHFLYRNRNDIIDKYGECNADILVFDYYIAQVDAFSSYFLNSAEYKEFFKHYQMVTTKLPLPDLVIYLNVDSVLNLSRIRERKRFYENVEDEFITIIQNKQIEHFESLKKKTNVLELDSSVDIINSLANRLEVLRKMVANLPPCFGNMSNISGNR